MDNQFYTVPELAEHWKVSPFTVYRLLERRELPGFKIGKAWRISAATVVAYERFKTQHISADTVVTYEPLRTQQRVVS